MNTIVIIFFSSKESLLDDDGVENLTDRAEGETAVDEAVVVIRKRR